MDHRPGSLHPRVISTTAANGAPGVRVRVHRARTIRRGSHLGAFVVGISLPTSVVYCGTINIIQLQKRGLAARARRIPIDLDIVYDATDNGDTVVEHVRTMQDPANANVHGGIKLPPVPRFGHPPLGPHHTRHRSTQYLDTRRLRSSNDVSRNQPKQDTPI